jgi:hypothetical protein
LGDDGVSDLDKYIQGKPLNRRMEELMAGADPDDLYSSAASEQARGRSYKDERELDDGDREHLRRLTLEPGWPILLRMLDRFIAAQEENMRRFSLASPLSERDRMAEGWAEVAAMRRNRERIEAMIETELRVLQQHRREQQGGDGPTA